MSLQLPSRKWSFNEWVDYVIGRKNEVFSSKKDTKLKVYFVHSNDSAKKELLTQQFTREEGDFTVITMSYHESATKVKKDTEYWMHEKEPGLLMFFTASTKEGYEKTLRDKIGSLAGLHEMWIKPTTFKKITKNLINEKECGIIKFLADRRRYDDTPNK